MATVASSLPPFSAIVAQLWHLFPQNNRIVLHHGSAIHPPEDAPTSSAAARPVPAGPRSNFPDRRRYQVSISTTTTSAATHVSANCPALDRWEIDFHPAVAHASPLPTVASHVYLKDSHSHTYYLVDTVAAVSLLPYSSPLFQGLQLLMPVAEVGTSDRILIFR